MFHHPVYPSHPWRDTPALREHWVPVFDKHRVTSSSRATTTPTCAPIRCAGHRRVSDGEPGTIYVVSVAGDKFCDQPPRDYIEVGFTETSTYQTIEIDDQTTPPDLPSMDRRGRGRRSAGTLPSRPGRARGLRRAGASGIR